MLEAERKGRKEERNSGGVPANAVLAKGDDDSAYARVCKRSRSVCMINGDAQFGYGAGSGREEKAEWHRVARDAWEILLKKFSRGRWPGEDCDFDNP